MQSSINVTLPEAPLFEMDLSRFDHSSWKIRSQSEQTPQEFFWIKTIPLQRIFWKSYHHKNVKIKQSSIQAGPVKHDFLHLQLKVKRLTLFATVKQACSAVTVYRKVGLLNGIPLVISENAWEFFSLQLSQERDLKGKHQNWLERMPNAKKLRTKNKLWNLLISLSNQSCFEKRARTSYMDIAKTNQHDFGGQGDNWTNMPSNEELCFQMLICTQTLLPGRAITFCMKSACLMAKRHWASPNSESTYCLFLGCFSSKALILSDLVLVLFHWFYCVSSLGFGVIFQCLSRSLW